MPRNHLALIAGGLTVTFIAGYQLAPRELLDSEVESRGFFATDTKRVLAAAVLSLKADGKLRVYQYVGVVSVDVQRSEALGLLQGRQELLVPAEVTYYLDLDGLSVGDDVTFDEKAKLVRVRLPKLELGDVAMQPERARVSNEGLLTFSDDVVQELAATNYLTARRTFIKQAQQPTLVAAAKAKAIADVEAYLRLPLRAIGRSDVRVEAFFPD